MCRYGRLRSSLLAFFTFVSFGCGDGGTSGPSGTTRIVSLSPAVTQMVIDLGFEAAIVGIGQHDPAAKSETPVVGDLLKIDYEKLVAVKPTHVFVQPGKPGVPPRLLELGKIYGWKVFDYDIETIEDALAAIHDPSAESPERTVGGALEVAPVARKLVNRVKTQLMDLHDLHKGEPVGRVLILVGLNPMTAVGPGTFLSELLRVAGGKNVLEGEKRLYPVLDRERILTLDPEVVICVRSTKGPMGEETKKLEAVFESFDITAVKSSRVYEIADPVALLPSSSMPRVAAKIAKTIHPDSGARVEKIVRPPVVAQ